MGAIETIDVSRAVLANRWAGRSRAIARIVWLLGAPLSAWAIASAALEAQGAYAFGAAVRLALPIWVVLAPTVGFGLSFSILSLRPLAALGFVALGAGPAVIGWNRYLLHMDREVWQSVLYSAAYTGLFAFPFLATFVAALPLSPTLRAIARPAPPMPTPLAVLRELFSVWPGMRRSAVSATVGGALSYAASVPLSLGWLALPPLAFVAMSLFPLILQTKGAGEVAAIILAISALVWLGTVSQALLRSGARWLTRASFDEQVGRDQRAPILFLRSFQDDQVRLPDPSRAMAVLRTVFTLGLGRSRLDHILVEQFSRYGPSLALGSPGEKDLPFGAARVYVTHDTWKAKVAEVAERARYVILVADQTPGVEWEIRTFMDGPWREKTQFVCAPRSGDIRGNPVLAERLAALGVATHKAVVAAWWRRDGTLVLVHAPPPLSAEAIVVALQAFFRDRSGPTSL